MRTLGVDLAAADERTALAEIDWYAGGAAVRNLRLGVTDQEIVQAVGRADKAGLDCPLGWPVAFAEFLAAQQHGRVPAPPDGRTGAAWRRRLAYRVTDEVVRARTGLIPLSVSADRIAHAAFRCAALLAALPQPVDRTGAGVVVEVYPAAALHRWGLAHRGYKTTGHAFLVDDLLTAAPWLDLGACEPLCRSSHDAFDAVIAALAARAAALGATGVPDAAQRAAARTEGWIAVPTGELADLPDPQPGTPGRGVIRKRMPGTPG
ncbi:DUF429 domain-containing protein [Actinoplanes sp. N902-109]|uniref:DUF429 domain-containing protein n=1 Tax=Actinoplanes sp. (strain N902-109) TaxID=649831 RepID=UPI0003293A80|nr:DUF429 domain-containing protein [Actinoplanes sp. N902-109]AGL18533.1 hypothetical protein L083_5023 [Actinoplanes sp. N902-109]